MLNFLGTGSAFNTELGNNSAFVKKETSLILIDCGGTVFHRLQQLKLLEVIKNLYIIITHMHPDHVGSLGDVIFYNHYILKNKVNLIYPNKEHMEQFLLSIGVRGEMYRLISGAEIEVEDEQFRKFSIEYGPVSHTDTIEAYSFMLQLEGKIIYYSGDSNNISLQVLNKLEQGEIDSFYQDTCGLDYEANPHLSFNTLKQLIGKPYREKVYCMHLDQHLQKEEILKEGFNIAEVYK
ncbi:MBL fold metallo-hydrolase [Cellulosilyticum sp. I15G10I2]|uniref:MBL fold metallo-hydrolase n=1 Tax=Cellulosilyticum sp. I15G10I2 TaxID=1892843 RepID=UPI00085BB6B4|nr:MBL fold metallo-hydrolase [Cellulosilyticum sp. I15G10I2]